MTNNNPKFLLRDRNLLGFVRPKTGGEHLVQRASSAKVFQPKSLPTSDPAKVAAVGSPRPIHKAKAE